MVKLFGSLALGIIVVSSLPVVALAQETASAGLASSFGAPLPGLTSSAVTRTCGEQG
jgi:hypothetical protein